jgi:tripartite-type tricarboxylate transporter receptor subunit TctC
MGSARFQWTWLAATFSALALLAHPAASQQFPSKPIKIIVAFGPGGSTDTAARLYGQKMSELLNAPVIVENKPGGNQLLAVRSLLASRPDGYTLMLGTGSSLVQNPALRRDLPYDPLKDFSLIGLAVTYPGVIFVNPDLPVHTVDELVAYAAANPGKVNYGSAGVGTAGHLGIEALMSITGMKLTQIPYKADADVVREVMVGTVQVGMMPTLNAMSFIKSGKIRAIAVTSLHRLAYLPDVPSLAESGIKGLSALDPHTFVAFVGPAGMTPADVATLNDAVNKISVMPDVAARVRENLYSDPETSSPSSFREFLEREIAKWKELGKTVKLPDL